MIRWGEAAPGGTTRTAGHERGEHPGTHADHGAARRDDRSKTIFLCPPELSSLLMHGIPHFRRMRRLLE